MMMTMDQPSSSGFGDTLSNFGAAFSSDHYGSTSSSPSGDPDVDWSVFENAERYLLRDDSAWITRLSKDFWWNLERISEMITSEFALAQQMNNNNNTNTNTGASGGLFARPPIPSHTINKFNSSQTSVQQQQQVPSAQQHFMPPSTGKSAGNFNQPVAPPPMQFGGVPPRKIVGQRSMPAQMSASTNHQFRSGAMFSNGLASPPPSSSSSSSSGSTIVRPANNNNNSTYIIPDKFNSSTSNNLFQAFSSMSMGVNTTNVNGNNDLDVEYNPFQSKISFDNNMWGNNNSQQPISWQ